MIDPTVNWIVPRQLLENLAGEAAPPQSRSVPAAASAANGTYTSRLLVDRWLNARGVAFRVKHEPDGQGRTVYVFKECPFDASHADPDACIMQGADGKLSAHCFHNSCQGRGWQQFKQQIGPPNADHYDPPLKKSGPRSKPRPQRAAPESTPTQPVETVQDAVSQSTPSCDGLAAAAPAAPPSRVPRQVYIDPQNLPVASTMRQITAVLLAAGDCYRRAGQLVRIAGAEITPVLAAAELAGLLNHHAEVLIGDEEENEYKPLPAAYANTWLNHPGESNRLPIINMFTLNPVYTLDWRLTTPGYDRDTGIYFAGDAIEPRAGTEHLDRLLADFCFKTPGDRTNYIGMLLTTVLMPRFIGSKPAMIFNGNQPGLGKSILAQVIAILRDGRPTETATYNPNDEEFEKRLGAIVKRGATTIVIDNAKGRGSRNPRIESACLERSITDPILSFRLLGYSKEIRAENSHIFCITANSPDVSRDLVTRSVMVGLYYEGDPAQRSFGIIDPEEYALEHRLELLGELLGMVQRWLAAGSPHAAVNSRFNKKGWGPIIGGILATAGLPDFLANADDAALELDDTRREFAFLVAVMAEHPQGFWTPAQLVELAESHRLFIEELSDASPHAGATRLGRLAGRFVNERFTLIDGRQARFIREEQRKGMTYKVAITELQV